MAYFAKSNLIHNGDKYVAGQEVKNIDNESALKLIEDGIITTDTPEDSTEEESEEQNASGDTAEVPAIAPNLENEEMKTPVEENEENKGDEEEKNDTPEDSDPSNEL